MLLTGLLRPGQHWVRVFAPPLGFTVSFFGYLGLRTWGSGQCALSGQVRFSLGSSRLESAAV